MAQWCNIDMVTWNELYFEFEYVDVVKFWHDTIIWIYQHGLMMKWWNYFFDIYKWLNVAMVLNVHGEMVHMNYHDL